MSLRRLLLFGFALFSAFAVLAASVNVTGTWRTELPGRQGNPRPYVFHLKQAPDGALTGTVKGFRSEGPIRDGAVEGNKIRFSAENQYRARMVLMTFSGVVKGNRMELKVEFADGGGSLNIVAAREE